MDCGKILLNARRLIHAAQAADESVPVNLSSFLLVPLKLRAGCAVAQVSGASPLSPSRLPFQTEALMRGAGRMLDDCQHPPPPP